MKICILQTIHPPFDKRVFQKEGKSLAKAGHDVLSIAPSDAPLPESADGVRFEAFPMPKSFAQRFTAALRLIPRARKADADVYFCIDPETWIAGVFLKLLTGRKLVFDIHEYYPEDLSAHFPRALHGLVSWGVRRMMRITARLADYIVLTRQSFDDFYTGLRTPRTVVSNTAHLQPICTEIPQDLRDRFEGHPTLVHSGDFGEYRGSWQLLDAMKIVAKEAPDIRCILIGNYTTGSEEAFKQAIRDAGLEEKFDLPGTVPFDAVPAYVAVAQIGLLLFQPWVGISHRLAMPHKIFDYMREAKPFITTDFPIEIKRIVDECECARVVDVTDPQAIADGILYLLKNPGEAERLGANGRKLVETKYNWNEDERRLLAVFDALNSSARD
jgi:glycosyltransferase involved in cell wall biosynthesis